MLVPLIACEPAVFLFSPDGDIKQMGCDDVEHKPDEPRGSIRHLFLLRFALRYRGGGRRRDGADGAVPGKRAWP